jgi:hypothetical protein
VKSVPEIALPVPAFCTSTVTPPEVSTARCAQICVVPTFSATVAALVTKLAVPGVELESAVSVGIAP